MARIFDKILVEGVRKGHIPARTRDARAWFRDRAKRTMILSKSRFISRSDKERLKEQPTAGTGSMFLFKYDPKTKRELPYYDIFPLTFVIEEYGDGFLGMNLHYLPPQYRAKLMDQLYELANNQRYDERTKLRMSYQLLKGASRFKLFEPCVKRYLYSHVKSQFMYIYPSEWDIALFLPLEAFRKAGKQVVWYDSKKKAGVL